MKTWTMPSVILEDFAANEFVAACTPTGSGGFYFECDNTPTHDYGDGQHTDTWPHNENAHGYLPDGALSRVTSMNDSWWFDQNGNFLGKYNNGWYPIGSDCTTQYAYQFQYSSRTGVYYFHVYHRLNNGDYTVGNDGWHALVKGANPTS